MIHLIKYSVLQKTKNFNMIFWPLVFPIVMATLFYLAFGRIEEADFETVPVALVEEEKADPVFLIFLEELAESEDKLIAAEKMSESDAREALEAKEISGIFYAGEEIRLAVGENGLSQSILQSLLESYLNGRQTLMTVAGVNPAGIQKAAARMEKYEACVEQVSLGGRTINGNVQFFYALIAMACLYGAFIGFGAAQWLQANLNAFAARRCVSPTSKLVLILTEMGSAFLIHVLNVLLLILYIRFVLGQELQGSMLQMLLVVVPGCVIGVCMGIFIGSISRMGEGVKIAILLGISMSCSFFAGLMNGEMKNLVEQTVPLLNRVNPAALITDAFYCINVYEDPARFTRSLVTLSMMAVLLLTLSFVKTRRERYDSI